MPRAEAHLLTVQTTVHPSIPPHRLTLIPHLYPRSTSALAACSVPPRSCKLRNGSTHNLVPNPVCPPAVSSPSQPQAQHHRTHASSRWSSRSRSSSCTPADLTSSRAPARTVSDGQETLADEGLVCRQLRTQSYSCSSLALDSALISPPSVALLATSPFLPSSNSILPVPSSCHPPFSPQRPPCLFRMVYTRCSHDSYSQCTRRPWSAASSCRARGQVLRDSRRARKRGPDG